MTDPFERPPLEKIQLKMDQLVGMVQFSEEALPFLGEPIDLDGAFSVHRDPLAHTLRAVYRAAVAHLAGAEVKLPETWVDHLKLTVVQSARCPRWLRRRLGPTVRLHRYEARAYLPNMRFPKDRYGPTLYCMHALPRRPWTEAD